MTDSWSSNASSSTGVRVNVPAAERALAAIVSVKSATAAKSAPAVAVSPATATDTSVGAARVRDPASSAAVTVTVCAPPSSATVSGSTVSRAAWSSSSITSVVPITGTPGVRPCPVTRTSWSGVSRSSSTPAIVTVPVLTVALGGKNSVKRSPKVKSGPAGGGRKEGEHRRGQQCPRGPARRAASEHERSRAPARRGYRIGAVDGVPPHIAAPATICGMRRWPPAAQPTARVPFAALRAVAAALPHEPIIRPVQAWHGRAS